MNVLIQPFSKIGFDERYDEVTIMRKNLLADLSKYQKSNSMIAEELSMFNRLVDFIQSNENCFERSNVGHITTSILSSILMVLKPCLRIIKSLIIGFNLVDTMMATLIVEQ